MGYESEDQLHDDDYYCEQCRPELHPDILKYAEHHLCNLLLVVELMASAAENGLEGLVKHLPIHISTLLPLLRAYHDRIRLPHS